jgi:TPR repeat protein
MSVSILFALDNGALNAYKQHHYKKAFTLYKEAADKGDTTAQNALSYLYFNGVGVAKNPKEGLYWLQKAADKGDKRACFDLGMIYLMGENVTKDLTKAVHYLEIASKKGDSEATYNLALMYYNGDGVKQDIKKAASLLEVAAKSGHLKAKNNVGRVYMQLLDFKKAKYWLEENVKDGDKSAAALLKEIEAAHKE